MAVTNTATPAETPPEGEKGLLDQAIAATQQTDPDYTRELLKTFTDQVLKGTVKWDRNLTITINNAIEALDLLISKQLAAIMHVEEFRKLEGSWRGLHYLVSNTETGESLKVRLFNAKKHEIAKDLDKAVEFDQSQLFKKIYEEEFGTPGGEPYALLVSDYEFDNTPDDIDMLSNISGICAVAFCPFIASANATLFGFNNWSELSNPKDLEKIFESVEYAKWHSLRDSEDSRFVALTIPKVLSRLPYGKKTKSIDEFDYEEGPASSNGDNLELPHSDYCWMSTAYVLATRITHAFSEYGWCVAIRGAEGGGKVEDLPAYIFKTEDGDLDMECPTEVGITDRREAELSRLGFLSLCHYKETDHAVFFGAQTIQKPQQYDHPDATANAEISSRLPYIMAVSRFTHYLKIMARDKIGSFIESSDIEEWLNRWILNYVNNNPQSGPEMKSKYPLAEAKVQVVEVPGQPGAYNAVAWLRPWLQMEELTASMRLVARIPKMS